MIFVVGLQSLGLVGRRGVRAEIGKLVGGFAEDKFFIRRAVEVLLTGQWGVRIDVVSVSADLQVLMDPVSVLLHHVPVELVGGKLSDFPPCVDGSSPPGANTRHSQVAEVLEELRFIDLADAVPSDWNEVAADSVGVEQEH
jgi:hypothetical protein